MKLLFLSDPNSIHTIRWVKALAERGYEITIFGLGKLSVDAYDDLPNVHVQTMDQNITRQEGSFRKLKYLAALPKLKKVVRRFDPDLVHAHYATGYGLLGALAGRKPFFLSIWGSDIYSFPKRSVLHSKLIRFNLSRANRIYATSKALAKETGKYTDKEIVVIPFGIDLQQFQRPQLDDISASSKIVIGTVKSLEPVYGMEVLIHAFKVLTDKRPDLPLSYMIVGDGSLQKSLKSLADDLGLQEKIEFVDAVPHKDVPAILNKLSIFVVVSNSESFGVAVVEASACELPVIVSNVGGLPEVVEHGVTGLIVEPQNAEQTANAMEQLAQDGQLREKLGKAGRNRVNALFDWQKNIEQMLHEYSTHDNADG